MMWFPDNCRGILLGITGAVGIVVASIALEPMVNLRIPLEHFPSGVLKTELFAARADMPPDGKIRAYDLVVKRFSEAGVLELEIQAESCVFDRVGQVASSTNAVMLKQGDICVSGVGFSWNGTDETLQISKQSRVVFPTAVVKEKRVLKRVRQK